MRIWHPSSAALSKLLPQGRVGPKVFLEANKNTKNGEYASDMLRRASTSVSNWSGDLLRPWLQLRRHSSIRAASLLLLHKKLLGMPVLRVLP